ncbi:hypothetical protein L1049_000491 [Liquidambar formosana]|uniref:Uncharacterized protein n=1 Tax=Liquidambar formosana TaxID=63359 RepID=A0AAP0NBJ6_LIQFO
MRVMLVNTHNIYGLSDKPTGLHIRQSKGQFFFLPESAHDRDVRLASIASQLAYLSPLSALLSQPGLDGVGLGLILQHQRLGRSCYVTTKLISLLCYEMCEIGFDRDKFEHKSSSELRSDCIYIHLPDDIKSAVYPSSHQLTLPLPTSTTPRPVPKDYHRGIKSLSELKVLDLEFIKSNDTGILLQSLGAFSSLKTLYFGEHVMTGTINAQNLHSLSNLENFFLDFSSLNESFLQSIGVMTSLKVLSLSNCELNGTLHSRGLCELKNLQELDLSGNAFQGTLPSCLGNLTSLQLVVISSNQLTGNIALSPLTRLTLLEYLSLSNNHFQVPISFKSFFNHSRLKVILGDNNTLVEPMYQTGVPRFQLKVFILSNCRFDELNLAPPNFLYYQHDLRVVDLSHNNFGGKFLAWLLQNNSRLTELYVRNCSFVRSFELPSHPNSNLSSLDVSDNNVQGEIPTNISLIFPNLRSLNMSRNAFQGNIPSSFGELKSLESLDLSNNQLSGGIPEHLAMGCSSLSFFKLSNNSLHGNIFPIFLYMTSLRHLYLDGNKFEGMIPDISSAIHLSVLGVRNNSLSGKLPRWIGNLSNLEEIAMSKNHIEGPIPEEFYKLDMLKLLDLSENNLSSSIPPCSGPLSIRHVHLSKNRLTGPIKRALFYSQSLVTLDLGDNNLIGTIPNWIGNLSSLSILILKANHLEGRIPTQLCHLSQLSIMDLSRNNLSGTIPRCLSDITFDASNEKSTAGNSYLITTFSKQSSSSYVEGTKIIAGFGDDSSSYPFLDVQMQVEFTTKSKSYSYKGDILNFMSGIELSNNQLIGEIPLEIGYLRNIHALNLWHNNLTGFPTTFSNLSQIESLDLSYNNLSGRILSQLTELNYLAIFRVGYNNLSGRTLERKAQFAIFEESSHEGNPLLCGPPLHNNCTKPGSPSPTQKASNLEGEDTGIIDKDIFFVSFVVSYIIVLLGIATVLYINPYWRQAWFHLVEVCATSCYYFVVDNFHRLSIFRNMWLYV